MAVNPLGNNQSITLEKNKIIRITKRTVRFASNVYQTHNISSFSEGYVDIGTIPWFLIIFVFLIGLLIRLFNGFIGANLGDPTWLLILLPIAGVAWNYFKPKHYGFLLTLNSGDKKLFITTDKLGLRKVISTIYDFIESEKDAAYDITINQNQVTGNYVQGDVHGVVSSSNYDA